MLSRLDSNAIVYKLAGGIDRLGLVGETVSIDHTDAPLRIGGNSPHLLGDKSNPTNQVLLSNKLLGTYAPFIKTFIIRGIGYQVGIVENATRSEEFPYVRYLVLRVGHSFNLYKPIPNYIGVRVSHKDRKLVIYGSNKEQVSNYAEVIFKLRKPSVYTGRGIRIKKGLHRRKLGKKDIRKGKV